MHIKYQDQCPDEIVQAVGNPQLAVIFWEGFKKQQYDELVAALKAQQLVSAENYRIQMPQHELLGECVFRIATRLRNWIGKRFGYEMASDPAFVKELVKNNQGLLGINHTYDLLFTPGQERKLIVTKTRDLN